MGRKKKKSQTRLRPKICPYCHSIMRTPNGLVFHLRQTKDCSKRFQEEQPDTTSPEFLERTKISYEELTPALQREIFERWKEGLSTDIDEPPEWLGVPYEVWKKYDEKTKASHQVPGDVEDEKEELEDPKEEEKTKEVEVPKFKIPGYVPNAPEEHPMPGRLSAEDDYNAEPSRPTSFGTETKKGIKWRGEDLYKGELLVQSGYGDNFEDVVRNSLRYAYETAKKSNGGDDDMTGVVDFASNNTEINDLKKEIEMEKLKKILKQIKGDESSDGESSNGFNVEKWAKEMEMKMQMKEWENKLLGQAQPQQNIQAVQDSSRVRDEMKDFQRQMMELFKEQQHAMNQALMAKKEEDKWNQIEMRLKELDHKYLNSSEQHAEKFAALNKERDIEIAKLQAEVQSNKDKVIYDQLQEARKMVEQYSQRNNVDSQMQNIIMQKLADRIENNWESFLGTGGTNENTNTDKMMENIGMIAQAVGPALGSIVESFTRKKQATPPPPVYDQYPGYPQDMYQGPQPGGEPNPYAYQQAEQPAVHNDMVHHAHYPQDVQPTAPVHNPEVQQPQPMQPVSNGMQTNIVESEKGDDDKPDEETYTPMPVAEEKRILTKEELDKLNSGSEITHDQYGQPLPKNNPEHAAWKKQIVSDSDYEANREHVTKFSQYFFNPTNEEIEELKKRKASQTPEVKKSAPQN